MKCEGNTTTNRVIKAENTLRERLPTGQFLSGVTSILLQKWSKDRVPNSVNCLRYADSPTLSLKMWTEAYQWPGLKKTIHEIPHPDQHCKLYYVPSFTMTKPFTKTYLRKILNKELKCSTF